jgi:putative spermidine/putrescine transport system permease protein
VVRTVLASLQLFQFSQLEAAATLGAHPAYAVAKVLVPQIMPGIVAGALFAFVTSFDNYAVTMFLVDARSLTLPIKIINYTETSPDPTVSAIATLLFLMSVAALLIGDRMVGLKKLSGVE